eukprot:CAMPEP_0114261954 /NCGR_PEP_ID=MMETSP0058-20121206/21471_1 /TAXON_ID=36894 /ORGANISM="Pyramimonas parkeae, CCMP726" /LENGTH=76 /DNA_ID=CAMNT_0001377641 /DNA_START=222 /DNA_END=452 /DNA_ORIENTATION=+
MKPADRHAVEMRKSYVATHKFTEPPPDQVIGTEATSILLRHFYKFAEQKNSQISSKRRAAGMLEEEPDGKAPRARF